MREHAICVIVAGMLVAIGVGCAALGVPGCRPGSANVPTDADVRKVFAEHTADFVTLRDMILEEKSLLAVGDDNVGDFWLLRDGWGDPVNSVRYKTEAMLKRAGLAPERYAKYMALLKRVGGYRVEKERGQREKGDAAICLFRAGSVRGGVMKNIAFAKSAPRPLVDDTDAYYEKSQGGDSYSRLEDGWYIERQH